MCQRRWILWMLLAGLAGAAGSVASPADTRLMEQISRLADPDPVVREEATRVLWVAGPMAEALLKKAAEDESPEIAVRAKLILQNLHDGLLPDTPAEVVELLAKYRAGDEAARAVAVGRLAGLGPRALRVLLAIRRDEANPSQRQIILSALTPHAHDGALGLIAAGFEDDAETLLKAAAPIAESAARDDAAFLLVRGKLPARLGELSAELHDRPDKDLFRLQVFLARAAGDLPAARRAAQQTGDTALFDQILIEQQDWKELAQRYRSRIGDSASVESLGYAAAFARLIGDATMLDAAARAIKAHASAHAEDYAKCAEILFLNDRPADGIDLLIAHKDYLRAFDFQLPRMEYARALELLRTAESEHYQQLQQLRARSSLALRFMGRLDEARKRLDELEHGRPPDVQTWCEIIDARREIDGSAKAEELLLRVLSSVQGDAAVAELVVKANFPETFAATYWWTVIRRLHPDDPPQQTWNMLKKLSEHRLPAADLEKLAAAAKLQAMAITSPSVQRDDALQHIGQALQDGGRYEPAEQCFQLLAELSSNPDPPVHVGQCRAARGDWTGAAEAYRAASERDQTKPTPLVLLAAALKKLGDDAGAKKNLARAHLLPLSADMTRVELADELERAGFPDDAHREREMILATAPFLSWGLCHVVRQQGDAAAAENPAKAVELWERAFLQNLKYNVSFADAWANSAVPALIHKARAEAKIKSADYGGAVREAERCRDDSPGDADAMIRIVQLLADRGQGAEADAIFGSTLEIYRRLAAEYPNSGPLENLQAWFEGKCGRNLDDALQRAKRATELEPINTASLDTLAEVYYQRGQLSEAIGTIDRCIELEPAVEHHRAQLERFKKGRR